MPKIKKALTFHLVTSKTFWVGAPMVITEIVRRGHYVSVFDEQSIPSYQKLLECDVFIDMSAITRKSFYFYLRKECNRRKRLHKRVPLMIDPPEAIINSLDKRKTHEMFFELVPESYNLTGRGNEKKINKFKNDEFVVIKPSIGWCGEGVERLSPSQAIKKYINSQGLVVQKYIPLTKGVGRIVTLNYDKDFEIVSLYSRVPNSWRTGTDVNYKCISEPTTKKIYDFASSISKRCGLYLNGIDYIEHNGKLVLLEINAVPAMKEPYDEFGINIPQKLLDHIERSVIR